MTEDFESGKFELHLSIESEAKILALIDAGKVASATEAVLLAVELGLDKIAADDDFEGLSPLVD